MVVLVAVVGCGRHGRVAGALAPGQTPTACAGAASTDTTVYDTTQLTERPVPRHAPALVYPPDAERQHIQGKVVVTAVVGTDGVVEKQSVKVVQSAHPLLDAQARQFVEGTTLWPACRNGAPVRARIAVPFQFSAGNSLAKSAFIAAVIGGLVVDMATMGMK